MSKIEIQRTLVVSVNDIISALRETGYDIPRGASLLAQDTDRIGDDSVCLRWVRQESATRVMQAKEPTP